MLLAYQRDVHRMQHATRDPMSIQLYQYSHSKGILLLDTCHSRLIFALVCQSHKARLLQRYFDFK